MSDTYKGESPGKKLARFEFWDRVRCTLGPSAFARGPHLFLASREGGDVSVLRGLGVDPRLMVAAERNAEAAATFGAKHPEVYCHVGDVGEIAAEQSAHASFASVLLDFCSQTTTDLLDLVADVALTVAPGGVVGVGVMRGREQQAGSSAFLEQAKLRKDILARYPGPRSTDLRDAVGFDGRDMALLAEVNRRLERHRAWLAQTGTVYYHSRSSRGGGVPMMIVGSVLCRTAHAMPLRWFRKERHAKLIHPSFETDGVWRTGVDESILRENALKFDAMGYDAAAILNLPGATVAAWKAHASRGTYGASR